MKTNTCSNTASHNSKDTARFLVVRQGQFNFEIIHRVSQQIPKCTTFSFQFNCTWEEEGWGTLKSYKNECKQYF